MKLYRVQKVTPEGELVEEREVHAASAEQATAAVDAGGRLT